MATKVGTIEPNHSAFPSDAVYIRDAALVLLRVESNAGKRLWVREGTIPGDGRLEVPLADVQEPETVTSSAKKRTDYHRNTSKVLPKDVEAMQRLRDEGLTLLQVAQRLGIGRSTVERHLRERRVAGMEESAAIERDKRSDTAQSHSIRADFSAIENTEMPYSVRNAIQLSLSSAVTMAVLTDQPILKAHFEGYTVGFQSALAIICGAAGIDLSFLEVEHDDKSVGTNHGT